MSRHRPGAVMPFADGKGFPIAAFLPEPALADVSRLGWR
jgi:hypothetical protein